MASNEEELVQYALQALHLSFWIGTRAQQVTEMAKKANAHLRLPPRAKKSNSTGTPEAEVDNPTFMLAFAGLAPEVVTQCCDELNKSLRVPEVFGAKVTLINGPRNCVVSAPPVLTAELRARMGDRRAGPKESESRIPYSQRKLVYKSGFLPISVGFHHPAMDPIVELVIADCKRIGLSWQRSKLKLALLSTETGRDLRTSDEIVDDDLILHVTRLISVRSVDWRKNVAALSAGSNKPTLVLDFGPSDGIARLTARNAVGG